jgi:hypothetical protein
LTSLLPEVVRLPYDTMIHDNKTQTVKNVHKMRFYPGYQYAFHQEVILRRSLGQKRLWIQRV